MSMLSTRIQEVFSLSGWYQDILKRYEQLAVWTGGNLMTPNIVWLSGLFNPKAFLTAVGSHNKLLVVAPQHVCSRVVLASMLLRYA